MPTGSNHQAIAGTIFTIVTALTRIKRLFAPLTRQYWRRFPVAIKMSLSIGIILLLGMAALAGAIHAYQSQLMREQANEFGDVIAGQLASSVVEPLFAERALDRDLLLRNFALSDQVVGAALYDHNQQLLAEVGQLPGNIHRQLNAFITGQEIKQRLTGSTQIVRFSEVQFRDVVGGYVGVVLTSESVTKAYRKALQAVGVIALLLVLSIIPVAVVMGRQMARPIRELVAATSNHQTVEHWGDEIGQLAHTFQEMDKGLVQKTAVERRLEQLLSRDVARKVMRDIDSVHVEGEHVDATVLFADIVGFTAISEKMTPREVSDFLNEFFSYLSRCSQFFHGSIDKYIGDCIMVVFGAHEPDEQHRYHALACALVMQQIVVELNERRRREGRFEVQLRIGINSGDMVAGMIGSPERMEYTVVGDSVNLASRLCSEAQPGEILVPKALCDTLPAERQVKAVAEREITVRGKEQSLVICQVVDMKLDRRGMVDTLVDDLVMNGHRPRTN